VSGPFLAGVPAANKDKESRLNAWVNAGRARALGP